MATLEQERIALAMKFIEHAGFTFSDEMLKNYYVCLKTKPFLILAGMSGIGKTQITRLFAKAIGAHYLLIPVSSSWTSDRDLLGFYDPDTKQYQETALVTYLKAAILSYRKGADALFFLCLDEMNLARVEHYFAKFLSAMEGTFVEDRKIILDGTREVLVWPPNLFFIGTVNMDETTHSFSDKVLDRANSIEFTMTIDDLYAESIKKALPQAVNFTYPEFTRFRKDLTDPDIREVSLRWRGEIGNIWRMLETMNFQFGYRIRDEIELYILNAKDLLDEDTAFDLCIKQKILPKIYGGGDSLKMLLMKLQDYFTDKKYRYSMKKIEDMKRRLVRDDFTAYYPGQLPPRSMRPRSFE